MKDIRLDGNVRRHIVIAHYDHAHAGIATEQSGEIDLRIPSGPSPADRFDVQWELQWTPTAEMMFRIAVASHDFGVPPQIVAWPTEPQIVIGVDRYVVGVTERCIEWFAIRLDAPFFDLVVPPRQECLLVVHELGVLCVNRDGTVRWRIDCDIVSQWELHDDSMEVHELDGAKWNVNLASGIRTA